LYAHLLVDAAFDDDIPAAEQDRAMQQLMADLDNGIRSATSPSRRLSITYDKALLAGQWQSLTAIVDEIVSLEECNEPGWMDITAVPFGHARDYLAISEREIKCDPLSYGGWRSAADSHLWLGDPVTAIQVATEGSEKTSHAVMENVLFYATLGAGRFDEAESLIVLGERADSETAFMRLALAAARGDAEKTELLLAKYANVDNPDYEYLPLAAAIAGNREPGICGSCIYRTNAVAVRHSTLKLHPTSSSWWKTPAFPGHPRHQSTGRSKTGSRLLVDLGSVT
jgi:hypothetical protein